MSSRYKTGRGWPPTALAMWRHYAVRIGLHTQAYLYTMVPGKNDGTVHATGIDDGERRGSEGEVEIKHYQPWSRQRCVESFRPSAIIC